PRRARRKPHPRAELMRATGFPTCRGGSPRRRSGLAYALRTPRTAIGPPSALPLATVPAGGPWAQPVQEGSMLKILGGLRVIEGAAFVAAPLCGMTLGQLGVDVIRFDPIEGGLDARRWPVTRDGRSLYWAGLNKGKRS